MSQNLIYTLYIDLYTMIETILYNFNIFLISDEKQTSAEFVGLQRSKRILNLLQKRLALRW